MQPLSINSPLLNKSIQLVLLLTSLLLLKLVTGYANTGVDLTDEGYYLNWISNPWLYKYYVSQFGYIYYPVYKALGNSIVYLRQANILISYSLSWLLSYFVLCEYLREVPKLSLAITSTSLALPALYVLMITGYWLPSPSYNSLNFQGCLIAAIGFFVSTSHQFRFKYATAGFLIGLGGWLVFMAKPSTALLLAVIALLFYAPNIKKDSRILIIATVTSFILLLLSALYIDGSVFQYIRRYQGGLLLLAAMNSDHGLSNLLKLDLIYVDGISKVLYGWLCILIVLTFYAQSVKHLLVKSLLGIFLLILVISTLHYWFNLTLKAATTPKYHILTLTALLFSVCVYCLSIGKHAKEENRPPLKLTLFFLVLPYLYAAGTGNNYWLTAAGAMIFWVLTATLLLARKQVLAKQLPVILAIVVILSSYGIFHSQNTPYRQSEAISKQNTIFIDPNTEQKLVLANDTAQYLMTLTTQAKLAHFEPHTPVIDLTGHHPGALYFMGAKAIAQAWTIGGYKGSLDLEGLALYQSSCSEIANAWLLIEKEGRRGVSPHVLEQHGIKADKRTYEKLFKLNTQQVEDFGGRNKNHPDAIYDQYLLKPIDIKNQTQNCLAYRRLHKSPFQSTINFK